MQAAGDPTSSENEFRGEGAEELVRAAKPVTGGLREEVLQVARVDQLPCSLATGGETSSLLRPPRDGAKKAVF